MDKIFTAPALAGLVWLALLSRPASAEAYANARFGYQVEFPSALLVAEPEADNGDGRRFHSRDRRATFAVFGAYSMDGETPASIARLQEEECHGAPPAYLVVKPALVALSCRAGASVFYSKTLIRGDQQTTFTATYPAAEQQRWDGVVAAMAKSLAVGTP